MEAREATATGESCMRVDAIAKVTGRARYTDDYVMAGMCYAKYVRTGIMLGFVTLVVGRVFAREWQKLNIGTVIITAALVAFYAGGWAI